MNKNINLKEILKDCPKGTKLYSTVHGEVSLISSDDGPNYPIVVKLLDKTEEAFTAYGKLYNNYNDGECILFPSRDQRDWSKFTAPWYKKEKLVELKESDDEKIRRWIIDDIRYNMNNEPLNNSEYKKKAEKAIAWIEKQGEQNFPSANERAWPYLVSDVLTWKDGIGQYLDDTRVQELAKRLCSEYAQKLYNPSVFSISSDIGNSADKIEPIFRVGDWVVNKFGNSWHIDSLDKKNYQVSDGKGNYDYFPISKQDEMHLWTIQDAKDGDVLSFYSEYRGNKMTQIGMIEKYVGKHGGCSNTFKIYVGVNWDNNLQIGKYMGCSDIHPATKEQRDALMKAMNDAEYEWDADKKEIKKLVEVPDRFDPKTLKAYDKVLVNDGNNLVWNINIFSHIDNGKNCPYRCLVSSYKQCIPYNDDTKHLVGTTDEAPEYYRYWEE